MAGHSILYLGRGEFAAEYLSELETLPFCALLTRSAKLKVPRDAPSIIDFVLLEAGPTIARSGKSLAELIEIVENFGLDFGMDVDRYILDEIEKN